MFYYFPNHYSLSFKVLRAIGGMASGQSEFGEIHQACEKINPDDPDSWNQCLGGHG